VPGWQKRIREIPDIFRHLCLNDLSYSMISIPYSYAAVRYEPGEGFSYITMKEFELVTSVPCTV
jgi:hypothetical protein